MKKANWRPIQVFADCPYCGGALVDPMNGTYMIIVEATTSDSEFACEDCGKYSQIKQSAFKSHVK
jgi:uncharacterized protein with PIN domain